MGLLAAALFTSMYIRPVDMMWHGGQMPNWLPSAASTRASEQQNSVGRPSILTVS